jgi:protein deglycase
MKRVLCILENGFEEIETVTPTDLLRRAGAEVILAATSTGEITGKSGIKIIPDALLAEVIHQTFAALLLPGGPAVALLRKNPQVLTIIQNFHSQGKPIAAICAAPLLLHDAGLLKNKNFTAHSSTTPELPNNSNERITLDNNLLTSRGAGTALDFGLALIELLYNKQTAQQIATSIMA